MHIHPLYTINQRSSHPTTRNIHEMKHNQNSSEVSLKAGSPRSGERSALAQATDSRLGETAPIPLEGFANSRLGEAVSPG